MAATIPPDQIDRMLSGKEAAHMIVRLVEGRGKQEEMTGRFPRPSGIVEHAASFAVQDATGRNMAWFYFRNDTEIAQSVPVVFKDEARRRAMKFAEPLLDRAEHG